MPSFFFFFTFLKSIQKVCSYGEAKPSQTKTKQKKKEVLSCEIALD